MDGELEIQDNFFEIGKNSLQLFSGSYLCQFFCRLCMYVVDGTWIMWWTLRW